MSAFEFVILASLRAVQLTRGCTPRVDGDHKRTVVAQLEVASGAVTRAPNAEAERTSIATPEGGQLMDALPVALAV
jgi:DNA-directed RNA polymerase subunit K/omega